MHGTPVLWVLWAHRGLITFGDICSAYRYLLSYWGLDGASRRPSSIQSSHVTRPESRTPSHISRHSASMLSMRPSDVAPLRFIRSSWGTRIRTWTNRTRTYRAADYPIPHRDAIRDWSASYRYGARMAVIKGCPCGVTHEVDLPSQDSYERVTAGLPETVTIHVPGEGRWRVPRAFIACHGLKPAELPQLARQYGFAVVR